MCQSVSNWFFKLKSLYAGLHRNQRRFYGNNHALSKFKIKSQRQAFESKFCRQFQHDVQNSYNSDPTTQGLTPCNPTIDPGKWSKDPSDKASDRRRDQAFAAPYKNSPPSKARLHGAALFTAPLDKHSPYQAEVFIDKKTNGHALILLLALTHAQQKDRYAKTPQYRKHLHLDR